MATLRRNTHRPIPIRQLVNTESTVCASLPAQETARLRDLKDKGKRGEMSRRTLEVHDCKEARYRTHSYSSYPGPISSRPLILTNDYVGRWAVTVPDMPPWDIARFVCYR